MVLYTPIIVLCFVSQGRQRTCDTILKGCENDYNRIQTKRKSKNELKQNQKTKERKN